MSTPKVTKNPSNVLKLTGKIANASQYGRTEEADELRRELRELQLREHIEKVVDGTPPLTLEQRARLATLLIGGGA